MRYVKVLMLMHQQGYDVNAPTVKTCMPRPAKPYIQTPGAGMAE